MKLKTINEQIRQTNKQILIDSDNIRWLPERKEGGGRKQRVKGVKYMATEGSLLLGSIYKMQYTDDIL